MTGGDSKAKSTPEVKRPRFKETTVTNIIEIPMEDGNGGDDGDIKLKVAAAPEVRMQQVQTLKELDHDLQHQLPLALVDGIDLSLLTSTLVPQTGKNVEEDVPWTFDQLFTSLSSELRAEREAKEKEDLSKQQAQADARPT